AVNRRLEQLPEAPDGCGFDGRVDGAQCQVTIRHASQILSSVLPQRAEIRLDGTRFSLDSRQVRARPSPCSMRHAGAKDVDRTSLRGLSTRTAVRTRASIWRAWSRFRFGLPRLMASVI